MDLQLCTCHLEMDKCLYLFSNTILKLVIPIGLHRTDKAMKTYFNMTRTQKNSELCNYSLLFSENHIKTQVLISMQMRAHPNHNHTTQTYKMHANTTVDIYYLSIKILSQSTQQSLTDNSIHIECATLINSPRFSLTSTSILMRW